VRADGHLADNPRRACLEDLADSCGLIVDLATLPRGQLHERLKRDLDLRSGTALMPDSADDPVDEHDRHVARLAARQRSIERPSRKDLLARIAPDRVGIEVGQEPDANRLAPGPLRRRADNPALRAIEIDPFGFERLEAARDPARRNAEPAPELLGRGRAVGEEVIA